VEGRLLLDVVIGQSSAILKLLPSKDEALLIRWNAFLVLNFSLHIGDGIRRLDIQSNSLSSKSLDEDLHASSQTKYKVKSGFLLDVVISKRSAIFKLFSCEDKTLLIRWDTLLVLNFRLDIRDRVRRFNIQSNGLSSKSFHEYLHTSSQSQYQVEGRLFLDVIIRQGSAIFKLLPRKD